MAPSGYIASCVKVVHIITRLIVGGAQENTLLSCEGQHRLGHDVTLITGPSLGPEGSLMERALAGGYAVRVVNPMRRAIRPVRDYLAYRELVRQIRELRPDIVHTHSSKAGILGRWAAHRAGVGAIVHTIHGLAFTASTFGVVNGMYMRLEKRAAPITTRIVCVADAMREQSLEAGIGTPSQYVTIYSGMETAPFLSPPVPRQQVRKRLGLTDDTIVVGTIGRLFHLKGHEDLLALAPGLCVRHPKLRFLWIGDGSLRRQFERRMREMGMRDRFVLTGLVKPEQVPELAGAMDILVHPSRREGLARALPQAALAGKPVITYDVDGNREALVDQETGILVPPFEFEKLGEAISDLAGDPERCRRMGQAGRAFALARFDTSVMVAELDKLYRELGS
jgi:glycosyltransferase involved in cell wall biosynthesis